MERESEQMQASQPTLCRSGCGYYGSPATDNLCSLCYKEALKKKQQPPADARSTVSAATVQQQQVQSSPSPPPSFASMSAAVAAAVASPASTSGSMETAQPTVPTLQSAGSSSSDLLGKDVGAELDCGASGASSVTSGDCDDDGSSKLGFDDSNSSDKDPSGKKKKNRCVTCRKKVGLTGFECRCGGLYCSLHRYSDMHECSFDYRELGAQEIRRNNPVVVGEKIQKI